MPESPRLPSLYELVTLERVDSVLEEARRRAIAGAPEGTLVWAKEQTNARSRRGKRWLSPPGNLHLALIIRPDYDNRIAEQLALVTVVGAGHALAELVSPMTGLRYRWPNHIFLNDLLAGTVQMSTPSNGDNPHEWLVLSLSINVTEHPLNPEPEVYSSVHASGAEDVTVEETLEAFARQFLHWINRWADDGFGAVLKVWRQRADGIDSPIEIALTDGNVSGTLSGVDDDSGAALITTSDGKDTRVYIGEYFSLSLSQEPTADAGVHIVLGENATRLAHAYVEGDYALYDIQELFALGQRDEAGRLHLSRSELSQLKAMADAQSFDHDAGFIEMCSDIHRAAQTLPEQDVVLVEIG